MKPNPVYLRKDLSFWANVRFLSQEIGYTDRKTKGIKIPTIIEIVEAYRSNGYDPQLIFSKGKPTALGEDLCGYFESRSHLLETYAEPNLMDAESAEIEFFRLKRALNPTCPLPMNKQSGAKKSYNFLTGIVNMILESELSPNTIDYDPRKLTSISISGLPKRTLSRRVDGAFPSTHNPVAIWEIKEYYYTTTFGSRIADGVYETLLDGMELDEARTSFSVDIDHYLIVDAYNTWWNMGKSYLCRMCDMLHMGITTEILFGRETILELPRIAKSWVDKL